MFATEIGFAMASGVLLGTFILRLLLVTALNLDVGRWLVASALHRKHVVGFDRSQAKPASVTG